MGLKPEEERFLIKRARLIKAWRYVGVLLIAMMTGLVVWLFWSKPFLTNPYFVMNRIYDNSLEKSTLVVMAVMLPIVVLMVFVLLTCLILLIFAALSNEKRYLSIIQRELGLERLL